MNTSPTRTVFFLSDGTGASTTGYCSAYFNQWQSLRPFKLLSFVQD